MIRIMVAADESRGRDRRRRRLLLVVGRSHYHITRSEGQRLLADLKRFRLKPRKGERV